MAKKIIVFSVVALTALGLLFLYDSGTQKKDTLKSTFEIDATYYDFGNVTISFFDRTKKTNYVVLEILGMDNSFQKTFSGYEFVETVQISYPAGYGWKIHPITLLIDSSDLGKVSLKTEIHDYGEPAPPIIYGNP